MGGEAALSPPGTGYVQGGGSTVTPAMGRTRTLKKNHACAVAAIVRCVRGQGD